VPSPDALRDLVARLGHDVQDHARLLQALTHPSYANEHQPEPDNEVLAFLGDAVLALVVAEHLWTAMPGADVGTLTSRRADMVSGVNLARWARRLELGGHLRLGRGEERTGGQTKDSVLATALEALLAAVYLEGGLPAARRAIALLALW